LPDTTLIYKSERKQKSSAKEKNQWRGPNFKFLAPVRKSKEPRVKLFCFETVYICLLLFLTWVTNDTNCHIEAELTKTRASTWTDSTVPHTLDWEKQRLQCSHLYCCSLEI